MTSLQNSRGSLTFLLELLLTGLLLLLEGSHCQQDASNTGANFVYYYNSPTQRTHVTMNQNYGQLLNNNPFYSQNHQQSLPFATSQSPLGSFQYQTSSVQPLHQQFLYQQPTVAPAFTQSPLQNNFQFPFQQQVVTPPSGSFSTFNRFGKNLLNNQNQAQLANQAPPQHQQQGGSYSFFESPYQFLQQRFTGPPLGTPPTPSPTPEVTTHAAQAAPVPQGNGDEDAESVNRKPKFSSRFRYVEHQVNPYSRLSSFTSDLPFREQRFYSTAIPSVSTPTGYSYSIGTEDGSKATVHVSMGPASLTNYQHLTEVTGSRLVQRPQTFSSRIPAGAQVAPVAATTDNDVAQGAIPALPQADATTTESSVTSSSPPTTSSSTTTTPIPSEVEQPVEPEVPEVPEEPSLSPVPTLNATEETLIRESSFQTESIASPRPELSRKLSEINIPKRLVIRTRVARKRLQLAGGAGNTGADGNFMRRRISQNRLSDQDESKVANEGSKGSSDIASSTESQNQLNSHPVPSPATPLVDMSVPSTPSAPSLSSSTESGASNLPNQRAEDYYEYYTDQDNSNVEKNDKTSSDLPVLQGFTPNDFPGVFKHHPEGENSVETEQGEMITRYKSSRPASDQNQEVPAVQAPVSTESSRLAPYENPSVYLFEYPAVQAPSSTPPAEAVAAVTTTPTSTTSTQQSPSDDYEESHIPEQIHESPNLPGETSSTPSQNPETRDHLEAAVISSTTEQHQDISGSQSTEVSRHNAEDEEQSFASSSTSTTPESADVHLENVPSSTEESTEIPQETGATEFPQVQNVSPFGSSQDEGGVEEEVGESPSNTSTVATPTSTSKDELTTTEDGEPVEFEDFSYSQEEFPEENEEEHAGQEEDDIAQAQRLALQETLRRLRERQNMQDNSTAVEPDTPTSSNITSTLTGTGGRRRSRYFVRRPIAVANLTLPTSGPIPNINSVLEDNEGDLSRSQVIEKIQRFRANTRRVTSTTTKRPRRVTRPSSERAVQLDQVDSFSESSSVGVDVDPYYSSSSTPMYTFTTETLTAPLSHETTTIGEFSTISGVTELSPFPPTTSKTTDPSELSNLMMLPTTERTTAEMTLRSTTLATARTTTFSPTTLEYDEGEGGLYEEGQSLGDQLDEPEQFPEGVTTPATSSTREVFMTTTETTPSTTPLPTSSTPRRDANPQTAGQLVIHEILPTQPPLKEVSFVIGESAEEDQVIQESKELNHQAQYNVSTAIVRVEANVQISSSVSKKANINESDEQQPSIPREGKKVRVVMVKRRKTATGGNLRRQKRTL